MILKTPKKSQKKAWIPPSKRHGSKLMTQEELERLDWVQEQRDRRNSRMNILLS